MVVPSTSRRRRLVLGHVLLDAAEAGQRQQRLQTKIHLDKPAAVHITANSSAMSTSGLAFQTGFYSDPNPGVVWTSSYRNLNVTANQWTNFGSTASVNLPAGDQTIYWKIWVSGGALTLSSGSLLVEGFEGTGSSFTIAAAGEPARTFAPMAEAGALVSGTEGPRT
jgi:hypothetical protein